jgi:hypothetical protein
MVRQMIRHHLWRCRREVGSRVRQRLPGMVKLSKVLGCSPTGCRSITSTTRSTTWPESSPITATGAERGWVYPSMNTAGDLSGDARSIRPRAAVAHPRRRLRIQVNAVSAVAPPAGEVATPERLDDDDGRWHPPDIASLLVSRVAENHPPPP